MPATDGFVIASKPATHFGVGAIRTLPGLVRGTGAEAVVVVTDAGLAAGPVVATVTDVLADAGIPARLFSGVHPNPTTGDLAAGADAVAEAAAGAATAAEAAAVAATLKASAPIAATVPSASFVPFTSVSPAPSVSAAARIALVAIGGGSPIDAAKGIALAAVNPQRGRDLDYRGDFAAALPIVAVPTTAGTGAETSALGVVTDPGTHRKFYVGHPTAMPAAAILDPALTVGLPPAVTAATGLAALTRALESYLSLRPNPWSDGIALQVIRMIAANLQRACEDGADLPARSQMLLAAHMAGVAAANTGLGVCHAIGHCLGGRWNIAHGMALSVLLPSVLRVNLPVRTERLAEVSFALGVGDTAAGAGRNAAAAVDAVAALRRRVGLTELITDFGITEADFAQIATDALDDGVLAGTPSPPTRADICQILTACAG